MSCNVCGNDMRKVKGCKEHIYLLKDGTKVTPVKAGDNGDWLDEGGKCHDCGTHYGNYHHVWCDVERCAICGGQFISCDCDYSGELLIVEESNEIEFNAINIQKVKEEFIEQCKDYLKSTYKRLFKNFYYIEIVLKKDIYDFNLDELAGAFVLESANTDINHLIKIKNLLSNYIDWSIREGLRSSNINPLSTIENHWLEKFVQN